ncbi:hypothetical protein IMAU80009_02573 [Lactiplantibacillus plantarum]|nr:hypothetical protein [Lactiplantibacillus plantarum]
MKLSITRTGDNHNEIQNVPIGYDVKLNDISLTDIGNDMKVTELNLNMRAGENPKLTIYADADPMVIKELLTDVEIKKNTSDK